jgi:hypothetical protein
MPHWPQCVELVFRSTQAELHSLKPSPQATPQLPVEQTSSVSHWVPQVPQSCGSEAVSTHRSPHGVRPDTHWHVPAWQLVVAAHALPQKPQCALSLARLTHPAPQSVCPATQSGGSMPPAPPVLVVPPAVVAPPVLVVPPAVAPPVLVVPPAVAPPEVIAAPPAPVVPLVPDAPKSPEPPCGANSAEQPNSVAYATPTSAIRPPWREAKLMTNRELPMDETLLRSRNETLSHPARANATHQRAPAFFGFCRSDRAAP